VPDAVPDAVLQAVPTRVAAVVPARNEADRVAATVRAVSTVPGVDLVVVVDDGSSDDTAALETGAGAVALWQERGEVPASGPWALLLVDADLGEGAAACAALTAPVLAGRLDMAVALAPDQAPGGEPGRAAALVRRRAEATSGWTPSQPLSRARCLTPQALVAARPLARGAGVEAALTLDVLAAGYRVEEVPCALAPRAPAGGWRSRARGVGRYRDVARVVGARRLRARWARWRSR